MNLNNIINNKDSFSNKIDIKDMNNSSYKNSFNQNYYKNIKSISNDKLKKLKEKINKKNPFKLNNNYSNNKNDYNGLYTNSNWKIVNNNLNYNNKPKTCYFKNNSNYKKFKKELFNTNDNNKELFSQNIENDSVSQNIFFKKSDHSIIKNNFKFKNNNYNNKENKDDYEEKFLKMKEKIYNNYNNENNNNYKKINNNIKYRENPFEIITKNIDFLDKVELLKVKSLIESRWNLKINELKFTNEISEKYNNNYSENINNNITFKENYFETEENLEETDKSILEIKKKIEMIENNNLKF